MAKAIAYLIDAQISYSGMCQIYWKWSSVNAAISVTRFGKKNSSLWLKFIDKNKAKNCTNSLIIWPPDPRHGPICLSDIKQLESVSGPIKFVEKKLIKVKFSSRVNRGRSKNLS